MLKQLVFGSMSLLALFFSELSDADLTFNRSFLPSINELRTTPSEVEEDTPLVPQARRTPGRRGAWQWIQMIHDTDSLRVYVALNSVPNANHGG